MTNPSLSGRGKALRRGQPEAGRALNPMPEPQLDPEHSAASPSSILGSNSLRLVVFERFGGCAVAAASTKR